MQKIPFYLRMDGVVGHLVDSYGQSATRPATITRGMRAELIVRLLDAEGEPYELGDYASWDFVLAHDWDPATTPQLRVTDGISAEGSEITIPLESINTTELIAQLSKNESVTLGAELCGFSAGEPSPAFVCQFQVVVRNRRSDAGTGTPEPVEDGLYSSAQVDALLATFSDQISSRASEAALTAFFFSQI